MAGWLVSEGQDEIVCGWCGAARESTNQTASAKFLLHGCPQSKFAARDFKTVDDSLARHCPLQIHADLIGELLLPHSITRASGEAGPSPEQEALSGLPRLVVELFHRRTQFYTLV